jgi:hypothetical protein
MQSFEQGSQVTFYATFVDYRGQPATVSGTPQIIVCHKAGSSTLFDVSYQNMVATSGLSASYQYTYNIPISADRLTYTVIFSGTYSDGTNALGGYDYLVIPKKFYDRKGGGSTTRITSIWTAKEKNKVLEYLEQLLEKILNPDTEDKINKTIDSLSLLSRNIESYKTELLKQKEIYLEGQNCLLQKLNEEKKINFDDSKINKNIAGVQSKINEVSANMRNEKFGLIISQIEDLKTCIDVIKEEFDDFKKFYVSKLAAEVIVGGNQNGKNGTVIRK